MTFECEPNLASVLPHSFSIITLCTQKITDNGPPSWAYLQLRIVFNFPTPVNENDVIIRIRRREISHDLKTFEQANLIAFLQGNICFYLRILVRVGKYIQFSQASLEKKCSKINHWTRTNNNEIFLKVCLLRRINMQKMYCEYFKETLQIVLWLL